MQLKVLPSPSIPLSYFFLSSPISVSSRSVRRRFRSQTPHELWPPCWDINRRNCGGTLRLPGEMIVGSGERAEAPQSPEAAAMSTTCTYCARAQRGGDEIREGNNFLYSLVKTPHNLMGKVYQISAVIIVSVSDLEKVRTSRAAKQLLSAAPEPVRTGPPPGSWIRALLGLVFCHHRYQLSRNCCKLCCPWARCQSLFFFLFFFLMSSSFTQLKIGQLDFLVVSPPRPRAILKLNIFYHESMSHISHCWPTELSTGAKSFHLSEFG